MYKHFSFICKTSTLYSLFKAILYNTDQYKWQNYHITTVREIEGIIPSSRRGVGILTAGSPTKLTRTDTKDKHRGLQLPPPIQPKGQLLSCWFRHMSNSPKQTLKLVLLKQTGFVVFVFVFFSFILKEVQAYPSEPSCECLQCLGQYRIQATNQDRGNNISWPQSDWFHYYFIKLLFYRISSRELMRKMVFFTYSESESTGERAYPQQWEFRKTEAGNWKLTWSEILKWLQAWPLVRWECNPHQSSSW